MKLVSIVLLLLFYPLSDCFGQYIDVKGFGSRLLEKESTRSLKNSSLLTSATYNATGGTSVIEKLSRTESYTNPLSTTYINYLDYQGMCDYYINPYKKGRCNNKLNYLKEAHLKVLGLVQLSGLGKMNQGIKEQIFEKYTSITNTILFELEQLKMEVDQETYYRQLLFGHEGQTD